MLTDSLVRTMAAIAAGRCRSQLEIAELAGVSPATIKRQLRDLDRMGVEVDRGEFTRVYSLASTGSLDARGCANFLRRHDKRADLAAYLEAWEAFRVRGAPKGAADPMRPSPALLARLGSVLVHVEEFMSPKGHEVDAAALRSLLADAEVVEWIEGMRALSLLPVLR